MKKLLFGIILFMAADLYAKGKEGGNGGSGWVCREKQTQEVRWVKLLDTFEAESDPRIHASFSSDTTLLLQQFSDRLLSLGVKNIFIDPQNTSEKGCPFFPGKINCGWAAPGAGTVLPVDASIIFKPLSESCAGGVITREAIALRTNGRNVTLVPSLYNHLTTIERIAVAFHESSYIYASFIDEVENSDGIRPIAGKPVNPLILDTIT